MLLYLLRHAIAEGRAESDSARELTDEGVAQARSVAKKFRDKSPDMDRVISSPYLRAQQTASYMMPLFPGLELGIDDRLRPEEDVYGIIDVLDDSGIEHLLLVGHNPFMSKLLSVLVDGTIGYSHHVGNAELHCLSADIIAPGCAELVYTLAP